MIRRKPERSDDRQRDPDRATGRAAIGGNGPEGRDERGDSMAGPDPAEGPAVDLSPEAAALVAQLERERDESISARQRALADFANYQRRARENESRARQEGEVSLLRALLPVIDHFDLAISQDASKLTVEQLLGGVKIVRAEFDKVLEAQGVMRIEPGAGDEFDPRRHEAMMRQAAPGIAANHVVALLQPGFAIGDMVLRPAKVTVAPEE